MKVSITYCSSWNYQPKAVSLAAEIKEILGLESELIAGSGGIFDVAVDGKKVYSKHDEENQFPNHDDLIGRLKQLNAWLYERDD